MEFRTQFNHQKLGFRKEENKKPSLTVPDQAMSVSEIMKRFAQGLSVDGERVPVYHGEEDMPDLSRMDLAEKEELAEQLRRNIQEGRQKLQELKKMQEQQAQKEEEQERSGSQQQDEQQALDFDRMGDRDQNPNPPKYPKKTPPEGPRRAAGGNRSTNNP